MPIAAVLPQDTRPHAWNTAYARGDNFVFYPHEEVLRFLARHIRKRISANSFEDRLPDAAGLPILDVGCGIGRHMVTALDFGLEPYGFDLSDTAIATARRWLAHCGIKDADARATTADIRCLPWQTGFFGCAVSHGVLDSMPFSVACAGMGEVARVLRADGLFYCDLVAGTAREETVTADHEHGTVQSYFDDAKIDALCGAHFAIIDKIRIDRHEYATDTTVSRWHVTLAKR